MVLLLLFVLTLIANKWFFFFAAYVMTTTKQNAYEKFTEKNKVNQVGTYSFQKSEKTIQAL